MTTRWTQALIDQVRALAGAGRTTKQAATELGVSIVTMRHQAHTHGICFHGKPWQNSADRRAAREAREAASARKSKAEQARHNLQREIAAAKAEAATAPLYRAWPNEQSKESVR